MSFLQKSSRKAASWTFKIFVNYYLFVFIKFELLIILIFSDNDKYIITKETSLD